VAVTEKIAVCPVETIWLAGCEVIAGAVDWLPVLVFFVPTLPPQPASANAVNNAANLAVKGFRYTGTIPESKELLILLERA
jgi:hypothetical protein